MRFLGCARIDGVMRKNCTFYFLSRVRWINLLFLFYSISFSLSRGNSISSPLGISEWSPSMAVVQKWRQIRNHTQKDDVNEKKGAILYIRSMDGGFAVNEQNIKQYAVHCHRRIVHLYAFLSIALILISTMALTVCPKQWLNIEWVSAIVRQSPIHHSLIRYNGTALLPTVRSPMASVNAIVLQRIRMGK